MYVKSLVKLTKGRAKICLDSGTDFVLYKKEYESYGIEEESELSLEDYQEICRDILIPRCKKRALHLLEKQDRSEKNLRDKLKEGGYPADIIDMMTKDIKNLNNYKVIIDRRKAINYAINNAKENDIVLVLGKGNEDYQKLRTGTIHFNDIEECKKALNNLKVVNNI